MGDLVDLTHLDLAANRALQGSLPVSMSKLVQLTWLDVATTSVFGVAPAAGSLPRLQHLDAGGCLGLASSPDALDVLVSALAHVPGVPVTELILQDLDFGQPWTHTVPASMAQLRNLQALRIGNSRVRGGLPVAMAGLRNMRHLHMGNNMALTAPLLRLTCGWSLLESIYVSASPVLTEPFPRCWGQSWGPRGITDISMEDTGIGGELTDDLVNLVNLTYLALDRSSQMRGTLPAGIAHMDKLVYFNIGSCGFSGTLPQDLTGMTNLAMFQASRNTFSGRLPLFPPSLQQLDVSFNQFSGPLPEFGHMNRMQALDLSNNDFSGTIGDGIGNLRYLAELYVSGNSQLSGTLPASMSGMAYLIGLDLGDTAISGRLFNLTKLESLMSFTLSFSGIEDSFSDILDQLLTVEGLPIEELNVAGMGFNESLPAAQLRRLGNLNTLDISDNPNLHHDLETLIDVVASMHTSSLSYMISLVANGMGYSGSIPDNVRLLADISNIGLARNRLDLSGAGVPEAMGDLKYVTELDLSFNRGADMNLTAFAEVMHALSEPRTDPGGGSRRLQSTPESTVTPAADTPNVLGLVSLSLAGCGIRGAVPVSLFDLPALTLLNLTANQLSGTLPPLPADGTLIALDVSRNRLTGGVPQMLGEARERLALLDLSYNRLSGPLSADLGQAAQLRSLFVAHNQFTSLPGNWSGSRALTNAVLGPNPRMSGTLPASLTAAPSLRVLAAPQCGLSGELPREWSPRLEFLTLAANNLESSIPDSLLRAPGLQSVVLADNDLDGTLPAALSPTLRKLDLSYLRLSGTIPPDWSAASLVEFRATHNDIGGRLDGSTPALPWAALNTLWLSLNHLSGRLPLLRGNETSFDSIDVLAGNVFACPVEGAFAVDRFARAYVCQGLNTIAVPVGVSVLSLVAFLWCAVPFWWRLRHGTLHDPYEHHNTSGRILGPSAKTSQSRLSWLGDSDRALSRSTGSITGVELRRPLAVSESGRVLKPGQSGVWHKDSIVGQEFALYRHFVLDTAWLGLGVALVSVPLAVVYAMGPSKYADRFSFTITSTFAGDSKAQWPALAITAGLFVTLAMVLVWWWHHRVRQHRDGSKVRARLRRRSSVTDADLEGLALGGSDVSSTTGGGNHGRRRSWCRCCACWRKTSWCDLSRAVLVIAATLVLCVTPNVLYVYVEQADLSSGIKESAKLAIVLAKTALNLVLLPIAARIALGSEPGGGGVRALGGTALLGQAGMRAGSDSYVGSRASSRTSFGSLATNGNGDGDGSPGSVSTSEAGDADGGGGEDSEEDVIIRSQLSRVFATEPGTRHDRRRRERHRHRVSHVYLWLVAGLVHVNSIATPIVSTMLFHPRCLLYLFNERSKVDTSIDISFCGAWSAACVERSAQERACIRYDVTCGASDLAPSANGGRSGYMVTRQISSQVAYPWKWDETCPSTVLELYWGVYVSALMLQGALMSALRLFARATPRGRAMARRLSRRLLLCAGGCSEWSVAKAFRVMGSKVAALADPRLREAGPHKEDYGRIFNIVDIVVVFGPWEPRVAVAGALALAVTAWTERRLIALDLEAVASWRQAREASESEDEDEASGVVGLPMTALVLSTVVSAAWSGLCLQAGLLPTPAGGWLTGGALAVVGLTGLGGRAWCERRQQRRDTLQRRLTRGPAAANGYRPLLAE